MNGKVDKCDLSKTGKSFRVKIGDAWFGASKDSGVDSMVGKTITADVQSSDFGPWLENIKVANGSAPVVPTASTGGANGDRFYLPFVSNTVAHAIQAGVIKAPEDIGKWAKAAHDVAQALDTL